MEWFDSLPERMQFYAGPVFIVFVSIGAALSYLRSKKMGPAQPKVQEFYASGALSDMGPVKELVEQTGLLVQQQVRANLALEACALNIGRLCDLFGQHLADLREQREEDDLRDAEQRGYDRAHADKVSRARAAAKRTPRTKP